MKEEAQKNLEGKSTSRADMNQIERCKKGDSIQQTIEEA